jgi:hypothetical protein
MTMALTRRHQAVHDRIAGTTVQIRELAHAGLHDVAWERTAEPDDRLPSRARRISVIMLYEILLLVVFVALNNLAVSERCSVQIACSSAERAMIKTLTLAWMAAITWALIYGWRGRLFGARRAR